MGVNAYASSNEWYIGGDNKNGESEKAGKQFFYTDSNFNIAEYFHFCNRLLKKEKNGSPAPAMIVFCSFQQLNTVIKYGEKYGFKHYIPLVFIKQTSPQVLKANMKIVSATEYALVLYRDKLPKFRNDGKMIKNWFYYVRDNSKDYPKIHPTQKPVNILKQLIKIFTDEGDTVIDPCAGSGTTLRAALELRRSSYGFEISKQFCQQAKEKMLDYEPDLQMTLF